MAMILLAIMAAMSVGFYSAIEMGTSISDNQQYMQRSSAAAESALTFGKYQLTLPTGSATGFWLPANTWPGNLLAELYAYMGPNLNGTANMGSNNPTTQPSGAPASPFASFSTAVSGYMTIPGPKSNGSPTWMSTDGIGGQAYLEMAPVPVYNASTASNVNTMSLFMLAVGQNSNSLVTPITRKQQVEYNFINPIFDYGLVSYGQIDITPGSGNTVQVAGSNGSVLAIPPAVPANTKPIVVNGASTFSGDFYYTGLVNKTTINWGSAASGKLTVNGQIPFNGQYGTVFPNVTAPATPTFDSSAFAQFATTNYPAAAPSGVGNFNVTDSSTTTLTNAQLQSPKAGTSVTYIFNNLSAINGVLYLQPNVNVTFNYAANGGLAVNGWIVQANGASSGKVIFNGGVTQTTLTGSGYPANEYMLANGAALLLPNDTINFNAASSFANSIIGGNINFSANSTIVGSILNMGTSPMSFNANVKITITGGGGSAPIGVNGYYQAAPSTYTEVYP
jgi:hypothetical protein